MLHVYFERQCLYDLLCLNALSESSMGSGRCGALLQRQCWSSDFQMPLEAKSPPVSPPAGGAGTARGQEGAPLALLTARLKRVREGGEGRQCQGERGRGAQRQSERTSNNHMGPVLRMWAKAKSVPSLC